MDNNYERKLFYTTLTVVVMFVVLYYFINTIENRQNKTENYLTQLVQSTQQNPYICPKCTSCAHCTCSSESEKKSEQTDQSNQTDQPIQNSTQIVEKNISIVNPMPNPFVNPMREYDYRSLNDPLVPPYKRDEYSFLPTTFTRGFPSSYKKMGLLIDVEASNDDPYKFMILIGRLKYPGGSTYDYYVTENKNDSALKFDLKDIHKELFTDDEIRIPELGKTYKAKIDRNLGFDYTPFIF